MPLYHMTIEISRHDIIQVDISLDILGFICFYLLHLGISIDKDFGSDMIVWQWMLFDNHIWWTYLTLLSQFKIWVVIVGSILKTSQSFLVVVSFPFLYLLFYSIKKIIFCMSSNIMLVLSFGPKVARIFSKQIQWLWMTYRW